MIVLTSNYWTCFSWCLSRCSTIGALLSNWQGPHMLSSWSRAPESAISSLSSPPASTGGEQKVLKLFWSYDVNTHSNLWWVVCKSWNQLPGWGANRLWQADHLSGQSGDILSYTEARLGRGASFDYRVLMCLCRGRKRERHTIKIWLNDCKVTICKKWDWIKMTVSGRNLESGSRKNNSKWIAAVDDNSTSRI